MAKRKNATALFEVMQKDKRFARKGTVDRPSPLATPGWFFKSKSTPLPGPVVPRSTGTLPPATLPRPVALTAGEVISKDAARTTGEASLPATPVPAPLARVAPPPVPTKRKTFSFPIARKNAQSGSSDELAAPVGVKLDPDQQRITFRLTYESAIVAAFAVLVVILLAVFVTRRVSTGPRPVLAGLTTEQLRAGPARPDVAEGLGEVLGPDATVQANVAHPTDNSSTTDESVQSNRATPLNEPKPPTNMVVQDQNRTVGLNYVIVQSYPTAEEAKAACDALIKNDILCTVEKAPKGWPAGWYSVIGITGFDRISSSPKYERYIASIKAVGKQFAGSQKFKKFEPMAYKWQGERGGR